MADQPPDHLDNKPLEKESFEIEVAVRIDPDNRLGILLQLPWGWTFLTAADAREVADALLEAAMGLESMAN